MPGTGKDDDDDDMPPSEEDDFDEEAPALGPAAAAINLPVAKTESKGEAASVPLLAVDSAKSDAPSNDDASSKPLQSPRDRFRARSAATPVSPRAADPASGAGTPADDAAKTAAKAAAVAESLPQSSDEALAAVTAAAASVKVPSADEALAAATAAASSVRAPTAAEAEAAKAKALGAIEEGKALLAEMKAEAPPAIDMQKLPEAKRMEKYINTLAEAAEGQAPPGILNVLKPCLLTFIRLCLAVQPWVSFVSKWVSRVWGMLPHNAVQMIFGAALCYFGGTYTTSIAAVEAFRTMGYDRARNDLAKVGEQLAKVADANEKDDALDEDGDGVVDVDQISPPELVRRKLVLMARTIEEPERIQSAVASVWAACLAVLATLRLEFAATTAIALGIVDMVKFPIVRVVTPGMLRVLGADLKHWCQPVIETTLSVIAITVALYAYTIISAVNAALRGGKLFAEALLNIVVEQAKQGTTICPGLIGADFDPNESVIDEIIGYIIAFQGFMFQMTQGFSLPFPFNILLLPLTIIEWFLRLQISSSAAAG